MASNITITLDLSGPDGNIFFVAGHAMKALKEAGQGREAEELATRLLTGEAHSYAEALRLIRTFVQVIDTSGTF